ncbi:vacuolar-sorting protein SNF8 isoform X1 [Ammospiza caudacuta]|uniref:vacuolar-sorting protein SNF8 isoform X1 n=1 Tax=Ammospiza caudacuta TaxID=2857398 RepID=UPI0027381B1F|nr:vacuolar-sorting protein SNF8 isoform X1 [Ammospiza caudacuta]
MHRRGVGAGAIARRKLTEAKYKERGTVLAEDQLAQMSKQLETFRTHLQAFASKHKQEIRRSPEFRLQFQHMCAAIGVDPLASGKGFWAEVLGVGDFYYELGVQIIEVCLALRHRNGEIPGSPLRSPPGSRCRADHAGGAAAAGAQGPRQIRAGRQRGRPAARHPQAEGAGQRLRHHPRGGNGAGAVGAGRAEHGPHGGAAAGREKGICDSQRDPGQPQVGDGEGEAGAGSPAEGGHGLAGRAGSGRAAVLAPRALLGAARAGRRSWDLSPGNDPGTLGTPAGIPPETLRNPGWNPFWSPSQDLQESPL